MNLTKKNYKSILLALAKHCNIDKFMLMYCNFSVILAIAKDGNVFPIVTATNDFDYVYFSLYRQMECCTPCLHNETYEICKAAPLPIKPCQFAKKYNISTDECEYAIVKQLVQRLKRTKLAICDGINLNLIKPIDSFELLLIEADYN